MPRARATWRGRSEGLSGTGPSGAGARRGIRRRVASAQDRYRDALGRVEARRADSTTVDVGLSLHERDRTVLGGLLSGALAFRLFLFLVPFSLVSVAALSLFVSLRPETANGLVDELGLQAVLVGDVLENGGGQRGGLLIAAAIGLGASLYTALGAVRALWLVHSVAWGETLRRPPRIALGALAFVAVNLLLLALPFALEWARDVAPGPGLAATLLAFLV